MTNNEVDGINGHIHSYNYPPIQIIHICFICIGGGYVPLCFICIGG